MDVNETFNFKLTYGETFEEETERILQSKLPDYKVFRSNQTPGHPDRETYKTVDVIVAKKGGTGNGKTVIESEHTIDNRNDNRNDLTTLFTCECKLNTEYFRKCLTFNGWCPENNVVINLESFRRYVQADFTIYLISHQCFETCDYYRFWPISKIIHGPKPGKMNFRGVTKLNFDASQWYSAPTLEEAMEQIIKLEL